MSSASPRIWPECKARLRAEPGLKLFLTVLLNLCFYLPYGLLQRHPLFAPTQVPQTHLDLLIPFFEQAIWIYLSLFLLMPIAPLLMGRREQLLRYGAGILLIQCFSYLIFFIWPTWCPRPEANRTTTAYRLLTTIDYPLNAFPSLHAAFALFSALCAALVFRELRARPQWRIAVGVWCVLILLGTLFTKQHNLIDIGGGSAIGFVIYFFVFRKWVPECKTKLPPETVNESHLPTRSTAI